MQQLIQLSHATANIYLAEPKVGSRQGHVADFPL